MKVTEVSKFELANFTDEQILWFDVPVQNPPSMAIRKSSEKLEHEQLHCSRMQATRPLFQVLR